MEADQDHGATYPAGSVRETEAAISKGVAALLTEYYGREPDAAKTYVSDDLVVCLLRGGFTPAEEVLWKAGHSAEVIRQRMVFQEVMRDRLEHVVREATGRRVMGFMSGNHQDPDIICEVFVLAPDAGAV